jgi:GntR family transcriptional regulator
MISRQDPRPAYLQVADAIRGQIESHKLAPGDQLPAIAKLAKQHDVGTNTVLRAISHLRALGLVESQQGAGTFVRVDRPWIAISSEWWGRPADGESDHWTRVNQEHGNTGTQDLVFVGTRVPPERIRDELGIGDDSTAVLRDRVLFQDGQPMQLARSWFPHEVADGTVLTEPRKIKGGTPRILADLPEPPAEVFKETVSRAPTQAERITLDLPDGVPVLDVLMTVTSASGAVLEVGELIARGDRHRMRDRHRA